MSSPSIPVVSSADLDEVVVYDSGGEEFERQRHASVRDRSRWVWEHQVLLDGASMAFALIQDGLTQGSMVQPPELQQGMARLERLLAGHQ
ncbi:hypothetical protein J132_01060 [Termitomyces sp. J132]|nr:hypothetical protein J132_01060 [Termitomyces sp. J132]